MTPKTPLRKCAHQHCHRHVHGLSASRGVRHCRTCVRQFRYAFRMAREREVGHEVGRVLVARFYTTPNNLGDRRP